MGLGLCILSFSFFSIFLSIFKVHIQRLPISGTITKVDYIEGKFINATLDKASDENERLKITIKRTGFNLLVDIMVINLYTYSPCILEIGMLRKLYYYNHKFRWCP